MKNNRTKASMMWIVMNAVAKEFSNKMQMSMDSTLDYIYSSKLYKMLEIDDYKMWYYSYWALTMFLIDEYNTGTFNLSERG